MTVTIPLIIVVAMLAALVSLWASSLTYALRDFSRGRLAAYLEKRGNAEWEDRTIDRVTDLIFVTAFFRLFANIFVLVCFLLLFHETNLGIVSQYALAIVIAGLVTLLASVAIPHAAAKYAGPELIGFFVRPLHTLHAIMRPVTRMMHGVDHVVAKAAGASGEQAPQTMNDEIHQEIMNVVDEGTKEGVVDQQERQIIESVIQFRNTTAAQIMSSRPEIVGIDINAKLDEVKHALEESGHSRIPVYRDTLDQIIGILYARDLLKHLGRASDKFDIRSAMRPAHYVPESKPLRDLLQDFRLQKVHLAIVLDEYGGTAGLVTIEDILEELIGDISDEHEPTELPMLHKLNETTWEVDARVYIDELNRVIGLNIPEDAGYDTLGGFVSTTLGRIPEINTSFDHESNHYTIIDAEPQRVKRVKVELAAQPVVESVST